MRLRIKSLLFGNNMLNKATITIYPKNAFYNILELKPIVMAFKFVKAVERYGSMALTGSKT
jgi:hypothetical protein